MDVPEMVFSAVSLSYQQEVIEEPGAKISIRDPKLEKEDLVSSLAEEATVIAFRERTKIR